MSENQPYGTIELLGTWWVFTVFLCASILCTLLEWGRWTLDAQIIWITPIISLSARWYMHSSSSSQT